MLLVKIILLTREVKTYYFPICRFPIINCSANSVDISIAVTSPQSRSHVQSEHVKFLFVTRANVSDHIVPAFKPVRAERALLSRFLTTFQAQVSHHVVA